MSEETPLDQAHAAMETAGSDAARLRFYEQLGDSELFLLLAAEAGSETISPELFETPEGRFVLVFDREERLAQFAGRAVPYAGLTGRMAAQMLAGQGIGLGLNLEVAPSSLLLPAEAVDWLNHTLGHAPDEVEARIESFLPPAGLPGALLSALEGKLASAGGLAQAAYLAGVRYAGGGQGHLLGFVGAAEGARAPLAKAAGEALTFSGVEAGAMDVGFFEAEEPAAASLARAGLRFELPAPPEPKVRTAEVPGSNPDKPPRLR
ncbi:SseB family protein [Cribrihabitans pelagius]|uniref:SseB family protein n=1 Tax=Cribrihabitans pelagius TaxID=1765746 RepID=UPI003B5A1338